MWRIPFYFTRFFHWCVDAAKKREFIVADAFIIFVLILFSDIISDSSALAANFINFVIVYCVCFLIYSIYKVVSRFL